MKKTRVAAASTIVDPFQKGQVWRIGDLSLAVTSVGKRLVHYKRYKTQPKGTQILISSKPDLQKYLVSAHAILLTPEARQHSGRGHPHRPCESV